MTRDELLELMYELGRHDTMCAHLGRIGTDDNKYYVTALDDDWDLAHEFVVSDEYDMVYEKVDSPEAAADVLMAVL